MISKAENLGLAAALTAKPVLQDFSKAEENSALLKIIDATFGRSKLLRLDLGNFQVFSVGSEIFMM